MARLSLWAVPHPDDAAPLRAEIERLSAEVGAPAFAPHVTLLGGVDEASDDAVAAALATHTAFTATLVALADSDQRFMCVTATVEQDATFIGLRADLALALGVDAAQYHPHLSLVYAELPPARRAALREAVSLALPMALRIDAVELVDTSGEVEQWRTIRRRTLRRPA